MQKKEIDLSIIIISLSTEKYNSKDNLEIALKTLKPALKKIKSEVILVNNSTIEDGTFNMAKSYIEDIVFLKRDKLYQFGDNNNFGLKKAKGKYVLFLNNDIKFLDNNILKEMVSWMDNNPKVAVSSCALSNEDEKTLQGSGGSFPNLSKVIAWMTFIDDLPIINKLFDSYHPQLDYFEKTHKQDWVTGAFYLVRKNVLDISGGFDLDYNAYVEETDLSYRISKLGYDTWYLPKWKIVHFGSQSYGTENSIIFEMKNLKIFYSKHYPKWQLPILSFVLKFGCLLRIIVFSLFKPDLVKIYAKAFKTI
jgi:GT2 family glycosyltransferase